MNTVTHTAVSRTAVFLNMTHANFVCPVCGTLATAVASDTDQLDCSGCRTTLYIPHDYYKERAVGRRMFNRLQNSSWAVRARSTTSGAEAPDPDHRSSATDLARSATDPDRRSSVTGASTNGNGHGNAASAIADLGGVSSGSDAADLDRRSVVTPTTTDRLPGSGASAPDPDDQRSRTHVPAVPGDRAL